MLPFLNWSNSAHASAIASWKAFCISGLSFSVRNVPSPVSPMEAKRARMSFSESRVGAKLNWKSSRSKNRSEVFCSWEVSGIGQLTGGAAFGAGSSRNVDSGRAT